MTIDLPKNKHGFTLIELLIVIAILGALAVIILVIIDPAEQLAKSRDTGRISSVTQLGRTMLAYYSQQGEVYPDASTWSADLITTGQIPSFPSGIAYSLEGTSACTTNAEPVTDSTFCYEVDTLFDYGAIVFTTMESLNYRERCSLIGDAYAVFSTADGRAGIICSSGDPTPWAAGTMVYLE